jgi:beta-glucanase (GH16 family)
LTATHRGTAAAGTTAARRGGWRRRRHLLALPLLALSLVVAACGSGGTGPASGTPRIGAQAKHPAARTATGALDDAAARKGWKLTWSADFGKPGAMKKWVYYSGGTGFGLHQLQWYDAANATVDKSGQLVISADKGGGGNKCWYGSCKYTSARMETKSLFSQTYGEFEARIKFPAGSGLWPAFWIEGANVYQVGWPACGELDIIEPEAENAYLVDGYAHAKHYRHQAFLTVPQSITAGFHTYGIVWNPQGVTWYFDGHAYSHMTSYKGWPFDKPFFIILDLAVGGGYPGPVTKKTPFPAKMTVDWLRVYQHTGK